MNKFIPLGIVLHVYRFILKWIHFQLWFDNRILRKFWIDLDPIFKMCLELKCHSNFIRRYWFIMCLKCWECLANDTTIYSHKYCLYLYSNSLDISQTTKMIHHILGKRDTSNTIPSILLFYHLLMCYFLSLISSSYSYHLI